MNPKRIKRNIKIAYTITPNPCVHFYDFAYRGTNCDIFYCKKCLYKVIKNTNEVQA